MRSILTVLVVCAALLTAGMAEVVAAQSGIRAVDFRNFTYSPSCVEEGARVSVTNGVFHRGDADDTMYFEVQDVVYGDLTRDGEEEAVVRSVCNTGGTGQFSDGTIYTMRGGKPVEIGTLGIGDRADGGIHDIRIENGILVVDRFGQQNSGACCPEYIETERFRFDGRQFASSGKPSRRIYLSASREESAGPVRVRFLRGTSSATLEGSTNSGERYLLGARSGQTLVIAFRSKDSKASAKIVNPGGARLMTLRPGEHWSGVLPESGDVTISIESPTGQDSIDAYYDIDLTVR